MAGDTARGMLAQWRFDAPAGTTISGVQLWRNIGKRENTWELYTRLADGTKLPNSDCTRPVDQFTCQLGGPGTAPVEWSGLATGSVRVGIACVNTSTTCAPGGTLHHAWTAIYRSIVTIDDPTPPTATGGAGSLFAGGYVRGNATASVGSAADGSGIRAVQVRVDGGRVVGETPLTCDYTRSRPCQDVAAPVSVPVVTANIGDGTHTAQVGAVDAGGNFTAATTQTIVVDNDAPAPPTATSPIFSTTTDDQASISWAEPSNQVSPITTAHVTVCRLAACRSTTQPAGAGTGHATVALPDGPGAYTASVALADGAGNHVPTYATHWSITRTTADAVPSAGDGTRPPSTTTARLPSARLGIATPKVARDRRTITVRGTVAAAVCGQVRLTIRTRIAGRARSITKHATIARGRYATTVRLPSRRWRTATITARFARSATHRETTTTRTIRNR